MYLLDTNVISELRRPRADPGVVAWARARRPAELFLSALTIFEIDLGIRRVERRDRTQGELLRAWFTDGVLDQFAGRVLALDAQVAQCSAGLQVPDPRPERDCFIAATAIVHGLTLVTRNSRDFHPMGVSSVDPWQATKPGA